MFCSRKKQFILSVFLGYKYTNPKHSLFMATIFEGLFRNMLYTVSTNIYPLYNTYFYYRILEQSLPTDEDLVYDLRCCSNIIIVYSNYCSTSFYSILQSQFGLATFISSPGYCGKKRFTVSEDFILYSFIAFNCLTSVVR